MDASLKLPTLLWWPSGPSCWLTAWHRVPLTIAHHVPLRLQLLLTQTTNLRNARAYVPSHSAGSCVGGAPCSRLFAVCLISCDAEQRSCQHFMHSGSVGVSEMLVWDVCVFRHPVHIFCWGRNVSQVRLCACTQQFKAKPNTARFSLTPLPTLPWPKAELDASWCKLNLMLTLAPATGALSFSTQLTVEKQSAGHHSGQALTPCWADSMTSPLRDEAWPLQWPGLCQGVLNQQSGQRAGADHLIGVLLQSATKGSGNRVAASRIYQQMSLKPILNTTCCCLVKLHNTNILTEAGKITTQTLDRSHKQHNTNTLQEL